ncbi:hypothetical protein ACWFQT_01385 [Cellulosimicrobium cellulans]
MTTTTLPAPADECAQLHVRALYGAAIPDRPAHRCATLPDPARKLPRDTDTTVVKRVRAIATLFGAVEHARETLTLDLFRAHLAFDDIAEETQVYLEAALAPDVTWTDINTYATWIFDAVAGDPEQYGHAAALAAAALRGWTHRQALAAGGAR